MSLDDLLSQLKKEYLEVLPERHRTIARLIAQESWDQLTVEFHKLKGTGKTYGFAEVSDISKLLEKHSEDHRPPYPEALSLYQLLLLRIIEHSQNDATYNLQGDTDYQRLLRVLAKTK